MPKKTKSRSDSGSRAQQKAEAAALEALASQLSLPPRTLKHVPLKLNGYDFFPDGLAALPNGTWIIEVNAKVGKPKAATVNKVLKDALKLITMRHLMGKRKKVHLCLLFVDSQAARLFQTTISRSWIAMALAKWNIQVRVVNIPPSARRAILKAQKQQDIRNQ